jgi:hypothetical protein
MADENPEHFRPEEESKKDTVRINLPPGLTGRGGPPAPSSAPPAARPKPPGPPVNPEEEAKKETAVLGRPAEAPKPKKDTSRVQVAAAKPIVADAQRPAVKLRREEEIPAAPPAAAAPAATHAARTAARAAQAPAAVGAPSGAEVGLSIAAIVLSIVLVGFLAFVAFG